MNFLITGATGFIGSRLAEIAMSQGHCVRTLTRADWSAEPAVPHPQRYFGQFPNQIPAEALRDVEVVVHCAAVLEAREHAAQAVNVRGTVRLAELARASSVRTFIFLSSQSAKANAVSVYGRTKHAAELALSQLAGINVVILRPGLVCGTGNRGLFQRMCGMVNSLPILPLLGGGRAIVQPIHVDDLCDAVFTCAARGNELAGRFSANNLAGPTRPAQGGGDNSPRPH
jgi:nucleoside-diphosphate-sugar epimerase